MAAPLLLAGIQAGASALNTASTAINNAKARRHTEKMFNWQRDAALTDWRMQADYNSPAAQMQRLREAGLNPNLVYGNGADATMSAPPRSSSPQSWNPEAPQLDATSAIQAYQQTQFQQQQMNNMETQRTVMEAEKQLKSAQIVQTLLNTETGQFKLGQQQNLAPYVLEAAKLNLQKLSADIDQVKASTQYTIDNNMRSQNLNEATIKKINQEVQSIIQNNRLNKAQEAEVYSRINNLVKDGTLKQIEIDLRKKGINPSDPAYQRKIMEAVDAVLPTNWLQRFKEGFKRNNQGALDYLRGGNKK